MKGSLSPTLLNFCQITDISLTPGPATFLGDEGAVVESGPSPQLWAVPEEGTMWIISGAQVRPLPSCTLFSW